jgi:multidrug efflux system membrane fusion protein
LFRRILMAVLPIVVLAAGAYAALTMVGSHPAVQPRAVEEAAPAVRVLVARQGNYPIRVVAEGTVQPRTETQVVPEIDGRVIEVSPALVAGEFVSENMVLVRLDSRDYELAAARGAAAVAQAELRVAVEREEARVAAAEWRILGDGTPSPLALHEPQLADAQAQLASAHAAENHAKYDLERIVVRSVLGGRVREKRVNVGQYIQRGIPIATIDAIDAAEIRLPIPDSELIHLDLPLAGRTGDDSGPQTTPEVTVHANFAGRTYEWQGRVVRTDPAIDPRTRMIQAIVRVEDPYGVRAPSDRPPLTAGMFVQAEIKGRSSGPMVALPRNVLRSDGTVMVVGSDNRLEFRVIDVYRAEENRLLVRSGVKPGDRIVTSNVGAATAGMIVRVAEERE